MKTSNRFYQLNYNAIPTYLVTSLFVLGNLVLPQLFHLIPEGGIKWLPLYFFTLIGAYKYGWKVGLLVAIFSPAINSLFFGMPLVSMLPVIEMKSILLAFTAGFAAKRFGKVSILLLTGVVLTYQIIGSIGEWALNGSLISALQDFRIGIPGMLLQIVGGYLLIKYLINK